MFRYDGFRDLVWIIKPLVTISSSSIFLTCQVLERIALINEFQWKTNTIIYDPELKNTRKRKWNIDGLAT